MQKWLEECLESFSLSEEHRGYLLGRGAKPETIESFGIKTWSEAPRVCPEKLFTKRHGALGISGFKPLSGYLITPLRSPRGSLLGFEAVRPYPKEVVQVRLPDPSPVQWGPVFLGLPQGMANIAAGGCVWLVEGQFDLYPMQWVVPEEDAVLATMTARLTYRQLDFMKRWCKRVHFVYDRDDTGREAEAKALEMCRYADVSAISIPYSGGKDPGALWDNGGEKALRKAFSLER